MDEYVSREYLLNEYDRQHQGPPGGARKIIAEAPAADVVERPRWIPVTERLPDYPGRFMCYYEVNDYGEIGHCIDWGRYDPDAGWYVSGVTHWMPLPEPPKEETPTKPFTPIKPYDLLYEEGGANTT